MMRLEVEIPLGLEHTNNVFTEIIVVMDAHEQRYMRLPVVPTEQCTMGMSFDGARWAVDIKMGVPLLYGSSSMLLTLGTTNRRMRQSGRSAW